MTNESQWTQPMNMNSHIPASARTQSFTYQFSVESEIPHAELLSEDTRISAESHIVSVIYESFVITADQDYLTARLMAKSGLYRAFYWAAAQTIEKYLKAFLLLRGKSVKDGSHDIGSLFTCACTFDPSLEFMDIRPHSHLNVPDNALSYLEIFTPVEFLREIDKFGRPDNRYNSFGISFNSGHLFALDHFAFNLRDRIEVPSIWESMRKVDAEFLTALTLNNPWLSVGTGDPSMREQEPVLVKITRAVTKLDFLAAQINAPPYKLALHWLNRMMKLPAELSKIIDRG